MFVAIINCFDTYEERVDLIYNFFINRGDNVFVIQSNFKHLKKVKRTDKKNNYIFIDTKPYYKNISLKRLISHYNYTKKAFEFIKNVNPELLYVMIPPNSLSKFAVKYKRKRSNIKLIFDVLDLWPESMPFKKSKKLPLITSWQQMRNKNLKMADYVITECNLYKLMLKKELKNIKTKTNYLAKKEINVKSHPVFNEYEIHLCYLGSINHIIDVLKIKYLIKLIHNIKPVTFHIIGDGESRDYLIKEIRSIGAFVKYYGIIFSPQKKQNIFDECHFGLNIMKSSVCVGLTTKSVDYLQHGLPIINNIPADTAEIVERYNIGINVTDKNIMEAVRKITSLDKELFFKMRQNTQSVFNDFFSYSIFKKKMNSVMRELYAYSK